jgi:hypothetical protein
LLTAAATLSYQGATRTIDLCDSSSKKYAMPLYNEHENKARCPAAPQSAKSPDTTKEKEKGVVMRQVIVYLSGEKTPEPPTVSPESKTADKEREGENENYSQKLNTTSQGGTPTA